MSAFEEVYRMSSLQIIDVFESYYEGRSAPFFGEARKDVPAVSERESKEARYAPRAKDEHSLPRAA